jgi:hypothetical protein
VWSCNGAESNRVWSCNGAESNIVRSCNGAESNIVCLGLELNQTERGLAMELKQRECGEMELNQTEFGSCNGAELNRVWHVNGA